MVQKITQSPLAGKKVLITGNTGFKGAWLTLWLKSLGAQVSGLSVDVPFQNSMFERFGLEKKIQHHWVDIRDAEKTKTVIQSHRPEVIFHLAAQPLVRLSYDQPIQTFATNVMGTIHVLEAIRFCDSVKSVVLVTTDKVYHNFEWEFGYRENDRLGGHDPYSGSKAACELAIESYLKSYFLSKKAEVALSIARAGNVIGGGDYSLDRLIPDMVRAWHSKKPLVIRSPKSVRPWQHVLEPLSGYIQLAELGLTNPSIVSAEAFNFAPRIESGGTVADLSEQASQRWPGFSVQIESQVNSDKKETTVLRLSFDKARNRLGWEPRLTLNQALEWTLSWYEFESRVQQGLQTSEQLEQFSLEQIKNYEHIRSI